MSKPVDELQKALSESGLIHPVSSRSKGGWLEVLARQLPGQEKDWLVRIDELLMAGEEAGLSEALILARRYLRKEGKMVYGWYLSLGLKSHKELAKAVETLVAVLRRHPPVLQSAEPIPQKPSPRINSEKMSSLTAARPRPPSPGSDPPKSPSKAILSRTGPAGELEVVEMPLPHVYHDLNKPKEGSTRGARALK